MWLHKKLIGEKFSLTLTYILQTDNSSNLPLIRIFYFHSQSGWYWGNLNLRPSRYLDRWTKVDPKMPIRKKKKKKEVDQNILTSIHYASFLYQYGVFQFHVATRKNGFPTSTSYTHC